MVTCQALAGLFSQEAVLTLPHEATALSPSRCVIPNSQGFMAARHERDTAPPYHERVHAGHFIGAVQSALSRDSSTLAFVNVPIVRRAFRTAHKQLEAAAVFEVAFWREAELQALLRHVDLSKPSEQGIALFLTVPSRLFMRPYEFLTVLFGDFDLAAGEWRCPTITKTFDGKLHHVPLATHSCGAEETRVSSLYSMPLEALKGRALDVEGHACVACLLVFCARSRGFCTHEQARHGPVFSSALEADTSFGQVESQCIPSQRLTRQLERFSIAVNTIFGLLSTKT